MSPENSASGLDSTPGVVFHAPDQRVEIQVTQRSWQRVGTDIIDTEEGNRSRSFRYDDHAARSSCLIAPRCPPPTSPRRTRERQAVRSSTRTTNDASPL